MLNVGRHHVYQNPQPESTLAVGCPVSVFVFAPSVVLLPAHVHGKAAQELILQPLGRLLLPSENQDLAIVYRTVSLLPSGVYTHGCECASANLIPGN